MYRDFSASSKENLLKLVSEVENEQLNNFTDWVGDRWYDFESWIGKLNIKNYLNNVNAYHKKVIDKNNTTKKMIESIFYNVAAVDNTYKENLESSKGQLQLWQKYIDQMSQIVEPRNGKFDVKYIAMTFESIIKQIDKNIIEDRKKERERLFKRLNEIEKAIDQLIINPRNMSENETIKLSELLAELEQLYQENKQLCGDFTNHENYNDIPKKILSIVSKAMKLSSEKSGNTISSNKLKLGAGILGYIKSLYVYATTDYTNISDTVSGWFELAKGSGSVFEDVYKYIESNLSNIDKGRLGKVWQPFVQTVNVFSTGFGSIADAINISSAFNDADKTNSERIDIIYKFYEGLLDFYKVSLESVIGSKKLVKDVHGKYQWRMSYASETALEKIKYDLPLIKVITAASGETVSKYVELSEDGTYDMGDIAETGIYASVKGLTYVVKGFDDLFLEGMGDAVINYSDWSDKISNKITTIADESGPEFVKNHVVSSKYVEFAKPLKDISNNKNNNLAFRIVTSTVAGAGMSGAILIDAGIDGVSWIADQISSVFK